MEVLLPIWATKRETARRVRQRIGAVMKWAVAQGYREDNPTGDAISAALPKNSDRRQHQRALPHAQVAEALGRVRASRAHRATALAFEFLVLTACRSGEVRGARWDEVDDDAATWTVPPTRMKAKLEHRVPLSTRGLAVLDKARELSDRSGLIFRRRPDACSATVRFPSSSESSASAPCHTASGPASGTGPPSGPTCRGRSASSPWPTSTATAWRPPTGVATCLSVVAHSWPIGPNMLEPATHCYAKPNRLRMVSCSSANPSRTTGRSSTSANASARCAAPVRPLPALPNILTRTQRLRFHTGAFSIATTLVRQLRAEG